MMFIQCVTDVGFFYAQAVLAPKALGLEMVQRLGPEALGICSLFAFSYIVEM